MEQWRMLYRMKVLDEGLRKREGEVIINSDFFGLLF